MIALAVLVAGIGRPTAAPAAPADYHVSGPIGAPGGPFLTDRFGRVVMLHGVNAVYKLPPYELYPAPGQPWNLSAADARAMAGLGFDVVRLGILWQGLEPGTLGPDSRAVCAPGAPGNARQFDAAQVARYLARITATVDLLGRYHIYTLLDMHQDVYSQMFDGEGAPPWAVCTDGVPITLAAGRWSQNYADAATDIAYAHFWYNDVVGNLQGEYDRVWAAVASHFTQNPWVLGYDLYNEPFSRTLMRVRGTDISQLLECFYTGRAQPGVVPGTNRPLACPGGDPAQGLVPTIRRADPNHLVFYEPDIFATRASSNFVGPMQYRNLVMAFHAYCSFRSGVTGDPTNVTACSDQAFRNMEGRQDELPVLSTAYQRGGPAWFMGEFGATTDPVLLAQLTADANNLLVGWTYWQWKYYQDPTGSSDEAVMADNGTLKANAVVLAQPYPQAVAGTPQSVSYNFGTGQFRLTYLPNPRVHAPTIVSYPSLLSGRSGGYCAVVKGGTIVSKSGAPHILVSNAPAAQAVSLVVSAGPCGHRTVASSARPSAGRSSASRPPAVRSPARPPADRSSAARPSAGRPPVGGSAPGGASVIRS